MLSHFIGVSFSPDTNQKRVRIHECTVKVYNLWPFSGCFQPVKVPAPLCRMLPKILSRLSFGLKAPASPDFKLALLVPEGCSTYSSTAARSVSIYHVSLFCTMFCVSCFGQLFPVFQVRRVLLLYTALVKSDVHSTKQVCFRLS